MPLRIRVCSNSARRCISKPISSSGVGACQSDSTPTQAPAFLRFYCFSWVKHWAHLLLSHGAPIVLIQSQFRGDARLSGAYLFLQIVLSTKASSPEAYFIRSSICILRFTGRSPMLDALAAPMASECIGGLHGIGTPTADVLARVNNQRPSRRQVNSLWVSQVQWAPYFSCRKYRCST